MTDREFLSRLTKDELIDLLEDASKNWLAHDGLWFLAVERLLGRDTTVQLDSQVLEQFSAREARRIMKRLAIEPGGGLSALSRALRFRLSAHVNDQQFEFVDSNCLVVRVHHCRVQSTRRWKGMPVLPCKQFVQAAYASFAQTIDPRLKVRCLLGPPDPHPEDLWCAWEYRLQVV